MGMRVLCAMIVVGTLAHVDWRPVVILVVIGTLLWGAGTLAWMYWDDVITGPKDGVG